VCIGSEFTVGVLTVYCLAWVMYRNALGQVAQEGITAIGSTGQKVAHPAIGVASAQAAICCPRWIVWG